MVVRWDLARVAIGAILTVGSTAAARYLRRHLDESGGVEAVGFVLTLMIANILQLLGVVIMVAGFFSQT